jgi:hypothetical protein
LQVIRSLGERFVCWNFGRSIFKLSRIKADPAAVDDSRIKTEEELSAADGAADSRKRQ